MRIYTTEQQTILAICSLSQEDFDLEWDMMPESSFNDVLEAYKAKVQDLEKTGGVPGAE